MAKLSRLLDRKFTLWRLRGRIGHFASAGGRRVSVAVRDDPALADVPDFFSVTLRRRGRRVEIGFSFRRIRQSPGVAEFYTRRPGILVRLLAEANPSVEGFPGSIGDGCGARVAGFASADPTAILVPDPYFFNTRGYDGERRLGAADTGAWRERSGDIIWRGAPNGVGSCTSARMSPDDPDLIQRTRLCLILKGMAGVDAAFVDAAMATIKPGDAAALAGAGIVGSWIRTAEWKQRRFAIDVDGNTSAWSNLFHRLLLGCCVIKVGSQHGFRQWYYGDLVPWRHYVPVKPDMSDLVEKIEWCRKHPDECETIAAAGQALAMSMTFERELARGVDAINRAFGGKGA
ncbi:MAG: hypothetical protein J0H94_17500 [Rhizobiales bacterium]|mgnify:CR=1 FL=1|nr:hypothetical protein [Hyphomicrobiales bacterium]